MSVGSEEREGKIKGGSACDGGVVKKEEGFSLGGLTGETGEVDEVVGITKRKKIKPNAGR